MAAALKQASLNSRDVGTTRISLGNTTNLNFAATADLVITSPPYCTRIDYTAATRVELAIAEHLLPESREAISRQMLGTTKVPETIVFPKDTWGEKCLTFLDKVTVHGSKASAGYYYKTHVDYFDKLSTSIHQVSAALKPKALAILVVQDSYYKEIHNDLAGITMEMALRSGLTLKRREDYCQPNPLSSINSRARSYRKSVGAIESVLCFEKKLTGRKS